MRVEVLAAEASGWDRRRSDVAMRIELCALELCAAQGIDQTTIEDIASAAGISRRTFYRYFGTIDDILVAMPKRSLAQMAKAVAERPLSENIREAFVNAACSHVPTEADRHILELGGKLHDNYSIPWWRAMGRMQPTTQEVYEAVVAKRLEATGEGDPRFAAMIAAVLIAVIGFTSQQANRDGKFKPDPEHFREALAALSTVLK